MSVILFNKSELYQNLANAYEGLKRIIHASEEADHIFYKSLRRLHFANVATYLCQYHDDSPLSEKELQGIDPFIALQGKAIPGMTNLQRLRIFLESWERLEYNLVTNDGEMYQAKKAYEHISSLALRFSDKVIEQLVLAKQAL